MRFGGSVRLNRSENSLRAVCCKFRCKSSKISTAGCEERRMAKASPM